MWLFSKDWQKYLQSSYNNVKFHPTIIRYFWPLVSKPAATYDYINSNEENWDWICYTFCPHYKIKFGLDIKVLRINCCKNLSISLTTKKNYANK